MLSPDGRVIMITGANRGIGHAIATVLHQAGYSLSLGVRRVESLDVGALGWDPARVAVHPFEAGDRDTHRAWVAATEARFGRIDGLVNNAGINRPVTVEAYDEANLDAILAVNVKAPLSLINLALPHIRRGGHGRIVNIASLSGKRVRNEQVGYAMSKYAVMALTHATRRLAWDDGVRATVVCPSFVATEMTAEVTKVGRDEMIDPGDLAQLVATVIALPNTSAVAELLVNCRLEDSL